MNGLGISEEPMFTLNTIDRHAICAGFQHKAGARTHGIGYGEERAPTLTSEQLTAVYDARGNGDGKTAGTLTGDHESRVTDYTAIVLPFDTTQITSPQNGCHPHYGDPCHPLAAGAHPPAIAMTTGQAGAEIMQDRCPTLNCNHEQPIVAHALRGSGNDPQREDAATYQVTGGKVRRLTPLECERLQGYPDGWTALTKIEDMLDAEYDYWKIVLLEKARREGKARLREDGVWEIWRFFPGNGDDTGHWENTHKPYKHKTKKQMVAWYNRSFCGDTDSARYKALGNSIALPPWAWVLKRLCACYERRATMASLFDGIGGFPLIWERLNGPGSCLWASEIEEFPIAVTKARFDGKSRW